MENLETRSGDRFRVYITYKKLSKTKLAEELGTSRQTIHRIINNKAEISGKLYLKISKICKDLNIGWLVNGEGCMLKDSRDIILEPNRKNFIEYDKFILELKDKVEQLENRLQNIESKLS